MHRRHFLRTAFGTAATAAFGSRTPLWGAKARQASDIVSLGPDKIKLTRLAIGTGTKGGSIQRQLGVDGVANMLRWGYDQGVFFWETADAYKTHRLAQRTEMSRRGIKSLEERFVEQKDKVEKARQRVDKLREELNISDAVANGDGPSPLMTADT